MPDCHNDATFISDDTEDQAQAARLCSGCPFIQECGELGLGEKWGVYGGMVVSHPHRKAQRKLAAKTSKTHCRSGHAIADYGVMVEGSSRTPVTECRRCSAIRLHIALAWPGTPMPATEKRPFDPILHGSAAGYKAHLRAGTDPCARCVTAHAEACLQYRLGQGALERVS